MITVTETLEKVSNINKQISVEMTSEELTNNFLDKINSYRKKIVTLVKYTVEFTETIEGVTWIDDIEKEDHPIIKEILDSVYESAKDLSKHYAKSNRFCQPKGLVKEELRAYKNAISDLKEVINDARYSIFEYRENPETLKLYEELKGLI